MNITPSVVFNPCDCMGHPSPLPRSPKRVVNLMTGFMETDDVSLKGSPTVSPMTVAA